MNSNDEIIIQHWSKDNLLRIEPEAMKHLRVPDDVREFLANVGIIGASQLTQSLGISFDTIRKNKVETLASHFNCDLQENDISESLGSWIILGHCYDFKLICINTDNGSVILLEGDPESGFMDWFANSSIRNYILFITLAIQSFDSGIEGSTVAQALQKLTREFSNADPEAMRKGTHWWPMILDVFEIM